MSSTSCSSSASRGSGRSSSQTRSNRRWVERAELPLPGFAGAPRIHRVRPSLLQRRVVEKRVGPGVQQLVAERRRLGRVARHALNLAAMDAFENARERVEVHRLLQAVAHRLRDQRMIGNLAIAGDVLEARGRVGKHRRHQVVGDHALQLRRDLLAVAIARHRQRDGRVPAPARLKHRRIEKRLHEHVARGRRVQIAEDVGQRKRVLRSERQQQPVFGGRRLQLEVELAAEALAQRQSPRLVDAAAERRVQHQLHPAGLVEEALEDERVLRRQRAERVAAVAAGRPPPARRPRCSTPHSAASHGRRVGSGERVAPTTLAEIADRLRQLVAARRRLAEPERQRRRRALRVGDAHDARSDLHDLPRGVAELKDVAGRALDREVLVERADEGVLGIENDAVVGDLGNRAARRDGQAARAAPAAQSSVDFVAMHQRRAAAALRGESFRSHPHDRVELGRAPAPDTARRREPA